MTAAVSLAVGYGMIASQARPTPSRLENGSPGAQVRSAADHALPGATSGPTSAQPSGNDRTRHTAAGGLGAKR